MTDLASLGIVVKTTGVKEATRELGGLTKEGAAAEKQAARVADGWKKAGKTIGVGIAAGVGIASLALRKYFQNTIEAERVQAQLEARIKSTGNAARLSINDLNKMAKALQFKTSFDDESIGEVQAMLLTFTKIGRETFPDATAAVLDLSTAMGTDLNSAALQVGKALNDPVKGLTALSRAGIQFSAAQKAIIKDLVKTGDVAGAQTVILKELETQMGGSAEAARNTLGGALKALENSFNNLLEGDSGSAGIKGTRDAIEALNRTLNDPAIKRGVDDLIAGFLSIANAAVQAIGQINTLRQVSQLGSGSLGIKDASTEALKERRKQLMANIDAGREWRKEEGNIFERLTGGRDVAAYDSMVTEVEKIDARLRASRNARGGSNRPETGGEVFAPIARGVGGAEDDDKKKGRARKERERPDFSKEDAEDLRRLIEATAEADTAFEGLAATLAGPLQAAQFQYKQNLEEITELGKIAGRSSEEIAAAKALETQRYEEERIEIEKSLDVFGQLIEDKQFELDLMGLSNAERQTAIDLQRLGRAATEEETKAIRDLNQAYEDTNRTVEMMDDFRRSAADNLSDFVKGTKSAKDAALDFLGSVADMLIEMAAKQLVAKAFGDQGSTGAGTGGGDWISQLFGLFGGGGGSDAGSVADLFSGDWGFAKGGWTGSGARNKAAGIVHGQEGVLNADAMQRVGIENLNRLNAGAHLSQVASSASNGDTYIGGTTFVLPNQYTPQTQAQIDQYNARVQQRATARNS
ncbi:phage tail length tape measure family protein [Pseudoxanthomonas sacheonensis]|uniref:phage tail length tape measure family protein n=1 Tax=Pseudoxanthomonas sacheonensis TaxID=443615 RepID=UPI0013D2219C|nr:phage tail length tape measure family protein [Pseudoxanthomonas sacheonensis]KAF1706293.1 hypothetical protein CSC73_16445 [Pseudoxanthomonas sacheonensis]